MLTAVVCATLSSQCGFATTEEGNLLTEEPPMGETRAHRRDRGRSLGINFGGQIVSLFHLDSPAQ